MIKFKNTEITKVDFRSDNRLNQLYIYKVVFNGEVVHINENSMGLFYGGMTSSEINVTTRIDSSGIQIGNETSVGTARHILAGASL